MVLGERASPSASAGAPPTTPVARLEEMDAAMPEVCPPSPPISRCTRSRAAPGWTAPEMLTLANEVAAVEEDCGRALSTYQRWTIIADNCSSLLGGAPRGANRCRRRWDAMVADYRRIRAWEDGKKPSYWLLDVGGRRAAQLPTEFDREVFGAISRSRRAQERGAEAGVVVVSESEGRENHHRKKDDDAVIVAEVPGSKIAVETKSSKTAQRTRDKLQERAQHVAYKEVRTKSSKTANRTPDTACELQENADQHVGSNKAVLTKRSKTAQRTPDVACNLEEDAQHVGSMKAVQTRNSNSTKRMLDMACKLEENAQHVGSKEAVQAISSKIVGSMQDLACELQENALHVHTILKGEPTEDNSGMVPAPVDLNKPSSAYVEFTRRRADELIKALGSLISSVEHFTELADMNLPMDT